MSLIQAAFARLSNSGEKALIPFVTAGDPSLDQLPAILQAIQEAGADLVEVGIPFSDPIADGPTIQAASQRSLDRGTNPPGVLAAIKEANLDIPVIAMGYLNLMVRRGLTQFAADCVESGISGVIVCDLTPDIESHTWNAAAKEAGLETIYLAAPTSTEDRLKKVAETSTGFIYAVSRTGVTGAGSEAPPEVKGLVSKLRAHSGTPICVGFGISKPEHVRMVCSVADGAVVGSSLVDLIYQTWDEGRGRDVLIERVKSLKAATRSD